MVSDYFSDRPFHRFVFLLTVLLVSAFGNTAFALNPRMALRRYIHESWTTANGMPQSSAFAIHQDKDGYIWCVTEEGIVRFDGVRFTVFDRKNTPELETNNFVNIIEDKQGAYWFVPAGPQGYTMLKDGKFRTFSVKDGLPSAFRTRTVLDSAGAIWRSSRIGVAHLVGERFVNMTIQDGLPTDTIFVLYTDSRGRMWMGSNYHTAVYDNGAITVLDGKNGITSDSVTGFREDFRKNMWCIRQNDVEMISPDGKMRRYTTRDGLSDSHVNGIFEDTKHRLWFGTNKGLDRFENGVFIHIPIANANGPMAVAGGYEDHEGTVWMRAGGALGRLKDSVVELYTKNDGLPVNDVRSIFEDREGSLWLGAYGSGLFRLRDTKFVTLSTEDGLSENLVNAVYEDHDHVLWVGTFTGSLNRLAGDKVTVFDVGRSPVSQGISGITQDRSGVIWFASNGVGLYRIANGRVTAVDAKEGVTPQGVNALCTDSLGTVWIGGFGMLHYYRDGKFHGVAGYDGNVNTFFAGRNNILWVGTISGFDAIDVTTLTIKHFPIPSGLVARGINAINESSDGTLWLGTTDQGIIRFRDGKYVSVTPKDGLFDYNAFSMLEDGAGNLWMDCNKGIYRASLKELNDFADGKTGKISCISYGIADGMKNIECNGGSYPCAWRCDDGRLCFANVAGLATIYPADIKLNLVPPSVVIEQAVADQEPLDPRVNNVLAPGTEKFEFHFAGISFLSANRIQYRYKLEPFEKDWVDAGDRRDAYYTHIPPGDYTFRVKAMNSDGVWNELGATATFTLKPHFYESFWFLGLCIFGFVSVGPGIYFLRVRQLKSREAELKRIVDQRTFELQEEKANVEKALAGLKEAQQQLVLSEKMASLGQLTAGIAHEIKNPLNFVTNFATLSGDLLGELSEELQKRREKLDGDGAENIDELIADLRQNVAKINEHGKRADSIVRGMLLHSRGRAGERQLTDVNAILAEYTNLAYHGMRAQDSTFNVKIETHFDDSIGQVNIVPQDLSRVFLNIINNGCYSANEKRKHCSEGFTPLLTVASKNLGDRFEVRIRDNGSGVPKQILDKIFNPFYTTKPAGVGTGLGLSLSYDIVVQEHKGEIVVNTEEGEFAEFVITIPKQG